MKNKIVGKKRNFLISLILLMSGLLTQGEVKDETGWMSDIMGDNIPQIFTQN